jgi:hypothetical protein
VGAVNERAQDRIKYSLFEFFPHFPSGDFLTFPITGRRTSLDPA